MLYSNHRNVITRICFYVSPLFLIIALLFIENLEAKEADFDLIRLEVSKKCTLLKNNLERESLAVKANEKKLSAKIDKKELGQDALNVLIKDHLASIDIYNKKIEAFNLNCATDPVKKTSVAPPTETSQQDVDHTFDNALSDDKSDEILAAKQTIKELEGYFLQIGAFKSKRLAKEAVKNLIAQGWDSQMITRKYIYAVWVGPFDSRDEVKDAKEILSSEQGMDSYIIRLK